MKKDHPRLQLADLAPGDFLKVRQGKRTINGTVQRITATAAVLERNVQVFPTARIIVYCKAEHVQRALDPGDEIHGLRALARFIGYSKRHVQNMIAAGLPLLEAGGQGRGDQLRASRIQVRAWVAAYMEGVPLPTPHQQESTS